MGFLRFRAKLEKPVDNGLHLLNVDDAVKNIAGIIPARWASTRFPGKPLALLAGKPMILHVWEQCMLSGLGRVIIATDDDRIERVCRMAGAEVVVTDPELASGTDRCAVVAKHLDMDIVINIQGDEPFIDPAAIRQLGHILSNPHAPSIATLVRRENDPIILASPHVVKVVKSRMDKALYFSRQWLPFQRDVALKEWSDRIDYYTHIGIYGFSKQTLLTIASLPVSALEKAEQLEQLRWLDNGFEIGVGITTYQSMGIDTPEDLARAEKLMRDQSRAPENPKGNK